ncbi:MAG TPA: Ig-like domain-containing protein [Chloroflexia bacterium]|nr:Ig-like domain-containing protein [Chloroflexia bacterium]
MDTTAPTVIGLQPAPTATDVSRGTNVVATFSENMQKSTLTKANFKLYKVSATGPIQITNVTVTPSLAGTKATLNPYGFSTTRLANNTRYKAVLTNRVEDLAANALDANKVWSFRTVR